MPTVKLRTGLFLLVAGALVPVLLLALVLGLLLIDHERETFRRGAIDRNRAFFSAVDAAIGGHVATLKALSTSSNLTLGNVVGYERRIARILDSQPDWDDVILTGPDGRILVDAAHPLPDVTTPDADVESILESVRTGKPTVGNVVQRGPSRAFGFAIRYPIYLGKEVAYVLSAVVRPDQFQRLLDAQELPAGWASGVVDRTFHFVARIPHRTGADVASQGFIAEVAKADQGWYRGRTVEGMDTFTAFAKSPLSGWSMGLAIPASVVTASSRRAAWTLAIGTVIAIGLALAFAVFAGRRIAIPMASLAASARTLGTNEFVPSDARGPFDELHDVDRALTESSIAIAERQSLREREQAALRESDRAKDEFIAVLGHELRNPLSAIVSSVHLQRLAPEGSPAAANAREIIERQTRQMTRLVEDLMDISRLATGKLALQRSSVDLGELARHCVETWQRSKRIGEGRVRLDIQPTWVDADRARIEQVLANLLDNANKFSAADTTIDVRVMVRDGEGVLEVEDCGEGIRPEMIGQVFKPFVQGPQGLHRPSGGLGLGLSVVQRLVELHGGRVDVKSDGIGRGCAFTVRLPLAAAPGL